MSFRLSLGSFRGVSVEFSRCFGSFACLQVVLIDFGDVTSNATVKRGGRRLYRPPEVGGANYGPYLTEVGWSPPAWSYDVFSAGTFLLALGADPLPQDSMKLGRAGSSQWLGGVGQGVGGYTACIYAVFLSHVGHRRNEEVCFH